MNVKNIGFIGLGNMGKPMAMNLLRAGYSLWVYDKDPSRSAALVPYGAQVVSQPCDTVEPGGIVISMVPDDQALEEIISGKNGILESIGAGGIHLSMSTILAQTTCALASLYRERGSDMLVATVLGRPDRAAEAKLYVYLAGPQHAKQRIRPLLSAMGRVVEDYGEEAGNANQIKIASNYMILASLEAMGEVAAFLAKCGINPARFFRSLVASELFGGAVFTGYGKMIGENNFDEALFPVPLGLKDAQLILASSQQVGVSMPIAELARAHLLTALNEGWGEKDWSVLARVIAKEAELFAGAPS
jgi:3-hydroxyisobutyrate dehydrogenase-like beta-hydroxyacid dehydrogenase